MRTFGIGEASGANQDNFGIMCRSAEEIEANEVNLNSLLKLDNWTMCLTGSPDPFIVCCFVTDELIFVNLYHNYSKTHYHFFFDITSNEISGLVAQCQIDNYACNFPLKCMYNDEDEEVYSFYKQGEAFIIPLNDA